MGYYTEYELQLEDTDSPIKIIDTFRKDCPLAKVAFDGNGEFNTDIKWYSHKEDLLNISKKYPEVLFILEGVGDNADDVWRLYARNGKSFRAMAKLIYPEFEEELLT